MNGDEAKGVHGCPPGLNSPSTERSAEMRWRLNSGPLTRAPLSHLRDGGRGVEGVNENSRRRNLTYRWLTPCLTGACLGV